MKSMLTIALYRPEAFVFFSRSPELSRICRTSTIASKLVQTAFTASARATHLVFDRFRSFKAFSICSSWSFHSLFLFVLLVKKTAALICQTLLIKVVASQPCSITRLRPCGTHLVYGIFRAPLCTPDILAVESYV